MLLLLIFLILILIIVLQNKKIETFQNTNYNQIILNKQRIKNSNFDYNFENVKKNYAKHNKSLALFEIKNNKILLLKSKKINPKIHKKRIRFIKSLIKETLKDYKIPNMIFIVNLSDKIPDIEIPFLGCVFQKNKNCVAVPLNWWSYFGNSKYEFDSKEYLKKIKDYKRVDKVRSNKIIFRGSNNCQKRRNLMKIGNNNKIMDVKLPKNKKDSYFIPNKEIREKYQYYFVVRGRGEWTGSMNQFSLANGVLFIIEEDSKQPFELLLEPEQDYISIKKDLSNIQEQVDKTKDLKLMNKIRENLRLKTKFFEPNNLKNYIYLCLINLYN
jgi:hypothetical protein